MLMTRIAFEWVPSAPARLAHARRNFSVCSCRLWNLRDPQALVLRERRIRREYVHLFRVVHALGYRYRHSFPHVRHRQDAEAVATVKRVLNWLQESVPAPG